MFTRRDFFQHLGASGALAAAGPVAGLAVPLAETPLPRHTIIEPLSGEWEFRIDAGGVGERENWQRPGASGDWQTVTAPHTWQVNPEMVEHRGPGWYRKTFTAPAAWADAWVRAEFEAVYHTAKVWLNGKPVGEHLRKGYTAFTLDLSPALLPGQENVLVVLADNTFRDDMLPRGRSYDWAEDGGITRPVSLLIAPPVFIERLEIDAVPDLESGAARLEARCVVRNMLPRPARIRVGIRVQEEATGRDVLDGFPSAEAAIDPGAARTVTIARQTLASPRLWHFDQPDLYRLTALLKDEESSAHTAESVFGIRSITVRDGGLYVNGERVRLMGVERMAGSNPLYGMAEPGAWIRHDHDDLKELNCSFTRVHWAQDRRVLDYCDRHGILIQLEVPTWGPDTFKDQTGQTDPALLENGLEQLREMIARDRNHPSVFAWGVCNEINGAHPPAYQFAQRLYREAKQRDPNRLVTYASNSLQEDPAADLAAAAMDFISWNEYYESWYGGSVPDMDANLKRIHEAFPDKMIVVSEYGYCECTADRLSGDPERIDILREHTEIYRKHPYVGGVIFFSYNDYRTHLGDKGRGALKQRVHGVVDLLGARKPSFEALRNQSSPVERLEVRPSGKSLEAAVTARDSVPAHAMRGYTLRWTVFGFGGLPMEQHTQVLPDLKPGETTAIPLPFVEPDPVRIQVDVVRPTGFTTRTTEWVLVT